MGRREAILEGESPDVSIAAVPGPGDLVTVSSTDFFSPISQDPFKQGRIAAANTLSDVYAVGCTEMSNMLMILACSTQMDRAHRKIVTELLVKGFQDACAEAGIVITGGQTVLNPWPILGGVAIATVPRSSLVPSTAARPGDLLVLTKPLGTQVAANLAVCMLHEDQWDRVLASGAVDEETALRAVEMSELSMGTLNKAAAKLMRDFGAHGATDVTGFGLMGHARNLAAIQTECVDFELDALPAIRGMVALSDHAMGVDFRLSAGLSAETSGGLLIVLAELAAEPFLEAYKREASNPHEWGWVIGRVRGHGQRTAHWALHVDKAPTIIEV